MSEIITLKTYTLELRVTEAVQVEMPDFLAWRSHLRETEENLTDLLPEGYSVSITEWDAEEETPDE